MLILAVINLRCQLFVLCVKITSPCWLRMSAHWQVYLNRTEVKPRVVDIKKRLQNTEMKKDELLKDLAVVQNSLNLTQGQQFDFLWLCVVFVFWTNLEHQM